MPRSASMGARVAVGNGTTPLRVIRLVQRLEGWLAERLDKVRRRMAVPPYGQVPRSSMVGRRLQR